MNIIVRRFAFDAGHRVWGHESKCANVHGHTYFAEVSLESGKLDAIGRVIDFGKVKEIIGGFIDTAWDHNILLHPKDPLLLEWNAMSPDEQRALFGPKNPYVMVNGNPTAENMAKELFDIVTVLLDRTGQGYEKLRVKSILIQETPNCWAIYEPGQSRGDDGLGVCATLPLIGSPLPEAEVREELLKYQAGDQRYLHGGYPNFNFKVNEPSKEK